jgi:hypothetical protein
LFVVASAKSDQTSDLRRSTMGSGWPESSQPNWQFWTKKKRTLSHASIFIKEFDQLNKFCFGNNTNHTMERIEPECQENKPMICYTPQPSGHRLILLLL